VLWAPAIAKTNGATASAADLNGATTTLCTTPANGAWTQIAGTAGTYTTAIAPTGTGKILLQGTPHTFGDSGTSIQFSGAQTNSEMAWGGQAQSTGTPAWLSMFFRIGSSGISTSTLCDINALDASATDPNMTVQPHYDTTNIISFILEPFDGGSSALMVPSPHLALDTDYWIQTHMAGVNERNHQLLVYTQSGGVWSLQNTFNYDVLCTPLGSVAGLSCPSPVTSSQAQANTTGTASSGSTALTVASGTGIVVGQVVIGTNIADPSNSGKAWTTVTAITGTSVTLSQNTLGALSTTSLSFFTPPATLETATSATATSGSTSLTIVANTYGTINLGSPVGGVNIAAGTTVTNVSGTTITLSLPTTGSIPAGTGVTFWNPPSAFGWSFGKYSSCSIASAITISGQLFDPFNDWGAFAPN